MLRKAVWYRRCCHALSLFAGAGACQAEQRDFSPSDMVRETLPDAGGEAAVTRSGEDGTSDSRGAATSDAASMASGSGETTNVELGETKPAVSSGEQSSLSNDESISTSASSTLAHDETAPGETAPGETSSPVEVSACDQNLLVNGGFEAQDDSWVTSSTYPAFEQRVHSLIIADGDTSVAEYEVTAREGSRFAYLGGVPDDEYMGYQTTLTQRVFVPEEAVGLVLLGYVWIATNESTEEPFDRAYVQLESVENDEQYWQFTFWTNQNASDGWSRVDEYLGELDEVRGKYVDVVVQASTDPQGATRFWFDELEVVVICQ